MPDEIRTPRLLLRPFRPDDIEDVMRYATDEEWARFLPVPQPYTRADAERFLAVEGEVDRTRTPSWAIVCAVPLSPEWPPPSVERGLAPSRSALRRTGQPPRTDLQPPDDSCHARVIGGINLRLSPEHRLGELGYGLARVVWGNGLATEAVRAVMDTAFQTRPDLNRLRAVADPRNLPSLRVMARLGMTREGVLRQNRVLRGELVDEVWCGILRSEWEAHSRPSTGLGA